MFFPGNYKKHKWMIILLIIILMHYDLSPNAIRPKKCLIKLSFFILQYRLFLINLKLKKTSYKAADDCLFVFDSVSHGYITQKLCNKVAF